MLRVSLVVLVALCCQSVSAELPDVAGVPAAAMSSAEFQPLRGLAGHWTYDYVTGETTPGAPQTRGVAVVYDNTTTASGSAYATKVDDPNYYVGDSLWLADGGLVDAIEFSVYNSSDMTLPLTRTDVEINFYDPYNAVLGTITLNDVTFDPAIDPGFSATVTVANLQGLGINLPYACMYAMYLSDVQGGTTDAGQVLYDPPTVGESPDMFYEGPADISLGEHALYFGGPPLNPVANFYFQVSVATRLGTEIIWDTGPTHTVLNNGTESWLGYTSGEYPACLQRWAAMPFRIVEPNTTITEMLLWWWIPAGYEADHVSYIIWNRTGLNAPVDGDQFLSAELGPYVLGGRDYRAKPYGDWVPYHTYDVEIPIPVGDYWLTLYGDGTYDGDPDPASNALAWESGGNYVPEELEQAFFWRACTFPDPGFAAYAPATILPGPEMPDADDRWNLVYVFRGTVAEGCPNPGASGNYCSADIDPSGASYCVIDLQDLGVLLATYNLCPGDPGYNPVANLDDADGTGCINLADLGVLLAQYGDDCN